MTAVLLLVAGAVAWRLLTGRTALPSMPAIDPIYLMTGLFFLAMTAATLGSYVFAGHARRTWSTGPSRSTSDGRRHGPRPRSRRRSAARSTCSCRPHLPPRDGWPARAAGCSSRARPAPARRTWPRRWPPRPACRSCSSRRPRSSRCTTARRRARSARTSRSCARPPGPRAGRSASSRRSTRSRRPAAALASMDRPAADRPAVPRRPSGRDCTPTAAVSSGCRRSRTGFGHAGAASQTTVVHRAGWRGRRRRGQRAARADAVLRHPDGWQRMHGGRGRRGQPLPARGRQLPTPRTRTGRRAAHRRDQPGRRSRPGAAAPGPVRPPAGRSSARQGRRRELVDHFLARKAHEPELDDDERRDALAGVTQGYTPGDDRAPARRGAGQRRPPRGRGDVLGRTSSTRGW